MRIAVDPPVDGARGVLGEADSRRDPVPVRQEGEVKVPLGLAARGRRLMPRVDEPRALLQRIAAEGLEVEGRLTRRA